MRKILQLLSFIIIYSYGQDRPAETVGLINNINSSVNLYEGRPNVSIPLFTIPVGNISLSNGISNNSIGINPTGDEGIFGLNWDGNLFGQITRVTNKDFSLSKWQYQGGVNLTEDEKIFYSQDCIKETTNLSRTYTKKKLLLDPLNNGLSTRKTDFNPDMFYFDFFGYKGYFVFDNWGQTTPIVVSESNNLKVYFTPSGINGCPSARNNIVTSAQFRIQDDKGNNFYFGGTYDSSEINYIQTGRSDPGDYNSIIGVSTRANYIVSWNLVRVELANGEVILGNYKVGDQNLLKNFLQKTEVQSNEGFPTQFPTQSQLLQANLSGSFNYDHIPWKPHYSMVLTKRAVLESITLQNNPNIKIEYGYFTDPVIDSQMHLKEINITSYNRTKKISLNQIRLGDVNKRFFLESLTIDDSKYSFEYLNTDGFPSKGVIINNYYGYWNGTDGSKYDSGLLKKVNYPTKGYEEYKYEKSDFSKYENVDFYNNYYLQDFDKSNIPLARVSSKISYDGNTLQTINYKYTLANGKSAGILEVNGNRNRPRYLSTEYKDKIFYSRVLEQITNKGITEYIFTDKITNPDIVPNTRKYGNTSIPGAMPLSKANERGKLLYKNIYSITGQDLESHSYEYQTFLHPENELVDISTVNCDNCRIFDQNYFVLTESFNPGNLDSPPNAARTTYIPLLPHILKGEEITENRNSNNVYSKINFQYLDSNINWHINPIKKEIITNKGTATLNYVYPRDLDPKSPCQRGCNNPLDYDLVGEQFRSYRYMLQSNIVTPVIEINKNENGKYSLTENLYYPSPFIIKNTRTSKVSASFDENNYNLLQTDMVDKILYDKYDSKSNYIQTTMKSGIPTTTIWGYNQSLPIAKLEGAKYEDVMLAFQLTGSDNNSYLNLDIVKKSDLDIDDSSEQNLLQELNLFRSKSEFKDYLITTYTYDPLIGTKSITPPSGITEFYKYDASNRLDKILDKDNNKVKEFQYNFAKTIFYNSARSVPFIKNNCPAGQMGSSVNYTVPASKYSSFIDQADADRQAQEEINQYGQNNANSIGTCGPIVCNIVSNPGSLNPNLYYSRFEVLASNINTIKGYLYLHFNNPDGINWQSAYFNLGNICPEVRPSNYVYYTPAGSSWLITVAPNGEVQIKWNGSGIPPSINDNKTFEFTYTK